MEFDAINGPHCTCVYITMKDVEREREKGLFQNFITLNFASKWWHRCGQCCHRQPQYFSLNFRDWESYVVSRAKQRVYKNPHETPPLKPHQFFSLSSAAAVVATDHGMRASICSSISCKPIANMLQTIYETFKAVTVHTKYIYVYISCTKCKTFRKTTEQTERESCIHAKSIAGATTVVFRCSAFLCRTFLVWNRKISLLTQFRRIG